METERGKQTSLDPVKVFGLPPFHREISARTWRKRTLKISSSLSDRVRSRRFYTIFSSKVAAEWRSSGKFGCVLSFRDVALERAWLFAKLRGERAENCKCIRVKRCRKLHVRFCACEMIAQNRESEQKPNFEEQ